MAKYGFDKVKKRDRIVKEKKELNLDDFVPTISDELDTNKVSALDSVAAEVGFVSRQLNDIDKPKNIRRNRKKEQYTQLHISLPVSAAERFVNYCNDNDLPYWKAIMKFLDNSGY